jgi:lysophospholipase L1-like esterase
MKETIFFGDSITEGRNCTVQFTDYFDSYNKGVGGTTIGEYSIYPVDGYSLASLYIKNKDYIRVCDNIYLEYGINDVSSIMCGFTDLGKVIVSFVKVLDGIKQINKHANIRFLTISNNPDIIDEYASYQCRYLSDDYFKGYDFNFPKLKWADLYIRMMLAVGKRVPLIPMIDDIDFFSKYLSEDKLHPNVAGHKVIAYNIKKYL